MPIDKQFDHQYIEEQNVAERYLKRTLPAGDRRLFEEHFADCPECMDRIALAEVFLNSTRPRTRLALEPEPPPAPLSILSRIPAERQKVVLALAVLLVAGIPAAFFSGLTAGIWNRSREDAARARTSLILPGIPDPAVTSYAVAVTDSNDKLVWAASGILIPAGRAISIPMSFDRLPAGEYRVTLRGRRDDGSSTIVSTHRIRRP